MSVMVLFFFRRKTAYEMLISDGSSDGCSSDLAETWRALDLGQALEVEILQRVERIRQQHRAADVGDVGREIAQRAPAVYSPGLLLAYGNMAQIGRASWRETGCQYVEMPVVAGPLKTKDSKSLNYTKLIN